MDFLFPLFLAGAATAAIPIIIHLIHKKRAPEVPFSTLRFLKICNMKTSRRKRIEDLILLLMRVLILSILAFALARPIIKSSAFGTRQRDIVLVVDNSMSMACRHQGVERYDEAREAAHEILKDARDDLVALVFTSGREAAVKRGLTGKLDTLDVLLAESKVSGQESSIPKAIMQARDILDEAKTATGEIYVIGDNQRLSWEAALPGKKNTKLAAPIIVYNCGREDFRNIGIMKIDFGTTAKVVGSPVDVMVTIYNSGQTTEQAALSLYIERQKVLQKTVELAGGASTDVLFQQVFDTPGLVEGSVELSEDSLDADNYGYFVLNVAHQLRILIVKGTESDVAYLSPDFYLGFALNPKEEPERSRYALQPRTINLSQLPSENVGDYGLIFVVDAEALSINEALILQEYAAGGASVIFVMGGAVRTEKYNEVFNQIRTTDVLLPGRLKVAVKKDGGRGSFWSISYVDFEHPFFAPFKSIGMDAFDPVHIYEHVPMDLEKSARALVGLEGGDPLFVEKNYGKGKVFLLTSSLDGTWNNLPLAKIFLPMVQSMAFNLAGQETVAASYTEGEEVVIEFAEESQPFRMELTDPDGFTRMVEPTKESPWQFVLNDIYTPGVYYYKKEGAEAERHAFVVNVDGEESQLEQIPQDEIQKKIGDEEVYFVAGKKELEGKMGEIREGNKLEDIFLILVLILLLAECYYANRYKPQIEEKDVRYEHA